MDNKMYQVSTLQALALGYYRADQDVMDYIFRDEFGTSSKTTESVASGIAVLLFGDEF